MSAPDSLCASALGFAYDEVNAVLAAGSDDLVDAVRRIEALRAIRRTKDFEPLAVSFKRIRKITEKAGPPEVWRLPAVKPELFTEEAERALHTAANHAAKKALAEKRAGKYKDALQAIAELRPAVDKFFTDVLVHGRGRASTPQPFDSSGGFAARSSRPSRIFLKLPQRRRINRETYSSALTIRIARKNPVGAPTGINVGRIAQINKSSSEIKFSGGIISGEIRLFFWSGQSGRQRRR